MPQVNLSDIQKAADEKYGNFVATVGEEELVFLNPVRMDKAKRKALRDLFKEDRNVADDYDMFDLYREVFELTARTKREFTALDKAVNGDPAVWEALFEEFSGVSELGEA